MNIFLQNGSVVSERQSAPPPPPPRSDVIKQQLQQASINNNTIVTISSTEPTKEQMQSIKKYQVNITTTCVTNHSNTNEAMTCINGGFQFLRTKIPPLLLSQPDGIST
jgi:hypothetical protein